MIQISCVYSRTASGRLALCFAAELWKALDAAPGALHILLNHDEAAAALLGDPAAFVDAERTLVLTDIMRKTGLPAESVVIDSGVLETSSAVANSLATVNRLIASEGVIASAANNLIIDHGLAFVRDDLSVLYPCHEQTLLGRNSRYGSGSLAPLVVPFGDGESCLPAAAIACEMAAALNLPVLFYHTTWKVEGLEDASAEAHMCAAALAVKGRLEATARQYRVNHSFVIERADDVVEGLLQCALKERAALIVMSRSAKTTVGCYVAQALDKTPVPLLALASSKNLAKMRRAQL
jgi:hypothetical protein